MSTRHFADDGSELRVPVIPESDLTTTCTIAALVSLSAKSGYQQLMCAVDSGGTLRWAFGINPSRLPFWFASTSTGDHSINGAAGLTVPVDTWCLIAFVRAGFNTRSFHVIPLGGTAVHGLGDLIGGVEDPLTTLAGYIALGTAGAAAVKGLVAVTGVWESPLNDSQIEALATGLSSDVWANNSIAAGGAWNYDQSDPADPVPDMTGKHVVISGTISGDADTNGITGTTIDADHDPPGWDFTFVPPPFRLHVFMSGGALNSEPLNSLGGTMSVAGPPVTLFDDVPEPRRTAGFTDYRLVYYRNDEEADVTADLYVGTQLESGRQLAVGWATGAMNADVTPIADRFTAPAGVTFHATGSAGVQTIPPGQKKGAWVRRVVNPGSPEDLTNPCEFDTDVDLA